jgi:hypothetical protein
VRTLDWGWKIKNPNVILKPVADGDEANLDFSEDPTFADVLYDNERLHQQSCGVAAAAKPCDEEDLVLVRVDGREFLMERAIVALHFATVLQANTQPLDANPMEEEEPLDVMELLPPEW